MYPIPNESPGTCIYMQLATPPGHSQFFNIKFQNWESPGGKLRVGDVAPRQATHPLDGMTPLDYMYMYMYVIGKAFAKNSPSLQQTCYAKAQASSKEMMIDHS